MISLIIIVNRNFGVTLRWWICEFRRNGSEISDLGPVVQSIVNCDRSLTDLSQLYVYKIKCKGEELYKHFASVRILMY